MRVSATGGKSHGLNAESLQGGETIKRERKGLLLFMTHFANGKDARFLHLKEKALRAKELSQNGRQKEKKKTA